jgi:hypothetical protein
MLSYYSAVMYRYHHGGRGHNGTPDHGNQHEGPPWDPARPVTFDEWSREVRPWLVITAERMGPAAQAAALQRNYWDLQEPSCVNLQHMHYHMVRQSMASIRAR